MSREQLDRAYELIKSGQSQEAISIIEAVIRADRENENAWWLLANATNDPAAKRNALNNVVRLTENAERANKARDMLRALDSDPYDFNDKPKSAYQSVELSQSRNQGSGCGKIIIGAIAIIGLCACISGFGIYFAARPIVDAVHVPTSYDDRGTVEQTIQETGSISPDEAVDGYLYHATEGDTLNITVTPKTVSSDNIAPFIFIYDMQNDIVIDLGQASEPNNPAKLTFKVPSSGDYLIAIRGFSMFGLDMGYGDYDIQIDVNS